VKLAIGVLLSNGFPVPAAFVLGLAELLQSVLTGTGNELLPVARKLTSARLINSQGFPVDTARNEICRLVLDNDDADYLLFLDADMRHPANLAHRLLSHNLSLVTGRYQMRKPPFHTVAMRKAGPGPHDFKAIEDQRGLVPIDRAGAGCLLIARQVLEDVRLLAGDNWFQYQAGPSGLRTVSEDMWFFEQAQLAGYQPWCDLDAVCGHIASFEIDPGWQKPYLEARDRAVATAEGAAV